MTLYQELIIIFPFDDIGEEAGNLRLAGFSTVGRLNFSRIIDVNFAKTPLIISAQLPKLIALISISLRPKRKYVIAVYLHTFPY